VTSFELEITRGERQEPTQILFQSKNSVSGQGLLQTEIPFIAEETRGVGHEELQELFQ